ncbi:alpha/beta hydrolase domain-containing protein [Sphingobium chlorophenolicum L-1]|uniref:Alpha/beta hydrolase domain-containing protein n=2 Tax=Sphingobium chlorophenolicum TaxID=46429 RepID=F6EZ92_SPHCR|nr:alpha/beta hydrolase domain-containing protein [Sphingobium chlorophenolicum L-1]
MPLDIEVEKLLAAMAAAPGPKLGEASAAEMRAVEAVMAEQMPAGPAVESVLDIEIPSGAATIAARLYRDSPEPRALMVYYHGGGWTLGGIALIDGAMRRLVKESGVAVLSVDYRLAPEHVFPAAVEDALVAARWASEHREELVGWDAPLLVGGESAGGNLAAVVSQLVRNAGFDIAAQLLACPCVASYPDSPSMRSIESPFPPPGAIGWFFDQYIPDAQTRSDPRFAPLEQKDLGGLPPAFVATAEYDSLREQGEQYAERLAAAGISCEAKRYLGTFHGFFELDGGLRHSHDLIADFSRFLDTALDGTAPKVPA